MHPPEQRHVLRPEHFTVAPHLLGLPLASPSRRLFAILLDLLLVAFLVHAGGGFLLALAAAFAFFRFAARSRLIGDTPGRGSGRRRMWVLRAAGAFMLFLVVRDVWEQASSAGARLLRGGSAQAAAAAPAARAGLGSAMKLAGGAVVLQRADDREEAEEAARTMLKGMREAGASDAQIREALEETAAGSEHPWMREVVAGLLPAAAPAVAPDSLAIWHAAALVRGDSTAADSLRPRLAAALARDSLDLLHGRVDELQKEGGELRDRAERAESSGLLSRLFQLLDELGIGFGWTGLYFTALTYLWRGQTPGKRLMGVRVMRLSGEPMTLWISFERFGGYAAGLVTGLLGFAQVVWDRNRQAIHDKITETVVVRDAGRGVTPPPPPQRPSPLGDPERRAPLSRPSP